MISTGIIRVQLDKSREYFFIKNRAKIDDQYYLPFHEATAGIAFLKFRDVVLGIKHYSSLTG